MVIYSLNQITIPLLQVRKLKFKEEVNLSYLFAVEVEFTLRSVGAPKLSFTMEPPDSKTTSSGNPLTKHNRP